MKEYNRKILIVLSFIPGLLLVNVTFAQDFVRDTTLIIQKETEYVVRAHSVKSIALSCQDCHMEGMHLTANEEIIQVAEDPHMENSALVMLREVTDSLFIYSGETMGHLKISFIDPGEVKEKPITNQRSWADSCGLEVVSPSDWRSGLPPPSARPSITVVNHLVIHHSATSNSVPDPFETIRSIYIYHTEVNGWSDIGYNYLIAPDGTVFQGRDDQGVGDPDIIIGAHMCGVNSGTMGICMLGTFTSRVPTDKAMKALEKLVSIKALEADIAITGSSQHAIGPPSAGLPPKSLDHVCGHRDGCRPGYTECPGDQLYASLETIKKNAVDWNCEAEEEKPQLIVFPNPTERWIYTNFAWTILEVYAANGALIKTYLKTTDDAVNAAELASGSYIFSFQDGEKKIRRRVVIQ